jgi:AcrR family transcriptional regulator
MQVNRTARAAAAELKRSRTRARLIDAAMRVVAERGPGSVSVSDIVAASGLSRGAFYNYFPGPDDLVAAVADKIRDDLNATGLESVAACDDPAEQLARTCLKYYERGIADPVWGWVWLQSDLSSRSTPRPVTDGFVQLFRRGVELGRFRQACPAAAASVAFGSMRMAARIALTSNAPPTLGLDTIRIVLMGLGMGEAAASEVVDHLGDVRTAA